MTAMCLRCVWALPLLAAAAAGGCYTYEPIEAPRPGTDVRARLEVEAAVRRSEAVGEPVRFVSGSVVMYDGDRVSIDVLVAKVQSTFQNVELRDTVTFARTELAEILERRLAPVRTAVFVAGVTVGTALLVAALAGVAGGGDDGGNPPRPPPTAAVLPAATGGAARVSFPVFRLPWPR